MSWQARVKELLALAQQDYQEEMARVHEVLGLPKYCGDEPWSRVQPVVDLLRLAEHCYGYTITEALGTDSSERAHLLMPSARRLAAMHTLVAANHADTTPPILRVLLETAYWHSAIATGFTSIPEFQKLSRTKRRKLWAPMTKHLLADIDEETRKLLTMWADDLNQDAHGLTGVDPSSEINSIFPRTGPFFQVRSSLSAVYIAWMHHRLLALLSPRDTNLRKDIDKFFPLAARYASEQVDELLAAFSPMIDVVSGDPQKSKTMMRHPVPIGAASRLIQTSFNFLP